jgi:hypothetical protein
MSYYSGIEICIHLEEYFLYGYRWRPIRILFFYFLFFQYVYIHICTCAYININTYTYYIYDIYREESFLVRTRMEAHWNTLSSSSLFSVLFVQQLNVE